MKKIAIVASIFVLGVVIGEAHSHVKRTMWGYVWILEPEPDFPQVNPVTQLVKCPNGELTLGPWHVRVLYDFQAPFSAFLQVRGR